MARFFPHFKQFGCFYFEFSIAPKGILWFNFGFGFTTINRKVSTLAIKQSLSRKSKNVWDYKRFKTFVTVSHDQSHVMYIPPKSIHHEGVPEQISQFFWDAMAEIQVETNVLIVQFKCNATDELSWVHSARCPVGTVLWPWGDILLISKDDKHSLFRLKSVKLTWNQNDWLVVSSCNVSWLIPSLARSITAKRSDDTKHPRNETKG